jgi:hypothetical protein
MKVLVVIDHPIICRHFVMSGALSRLVAEADVRFVFPAAGNKRFPLDPATLPLGAPFERLAIDDKRQQTWRWMLFVDQLRWRPGAHEAAIRRLRWMTLGWKAALLLTLAGLPVGSAVFRSITARRLAAHPNAGLSELLDRERPDVVLHPSVLEGPFINDLVTECAARNIPLVVAMNSWDNPSTKRAVVGKPDRVLVWGPQTRAHAMRFIGMPPERVVSFGAAQFDVFREPPRVDRAAFCARQGVAPSRRLVLFAGSNAQTDEVAALEALDAAIEAGRLPDTAIIYRPHPWGGGGRGGARLIGRSFRHVVIDAAMRESLEKVSSGAITLPDYRDTHDLLCAVDVVVSPLSTILLEAALHGKPAVPFIPRDASGSASLDINIPMLHFAEFLTLPDVTTAGTVEELLAVLARLVEPAEGAARGAALQRAAEHFVAPFAAPWRERIVDFLSGIVAAQRGA